MSEPRSDGSGTVCRRCKEPLEMVASADSNASGKWFVKGMPNGLASQWCLNSQPHCPEPASADQTLEQQEEAFGNAVAEAFKPAPAEQPRQKWECTCKGRINRAWQADSDCPVHGEPVAASPAEGLRTIADALVLAIAQEVGWETDGVRYRKAVEISTDILCHYFPKEE